MTLTEICKLSGMNIPNPSKSKIGRRITALAREKNIKYSKVEETVSVNDYPDEFIEDMQNIVLQWANNSQMDKHNKLKKKSKI